MPCANIWCSVAFIACVLAVMAVALCPEPNWLAKSLPKSNAPFALKVWAACRWAISKARLYVLGLKFVFTEPSLLVAPFNPPTICCLYFSNLLINGIFWLVFWDAKLFFKFWRPCWYRFNHCTFMLSGFVRVNLSKSLFFIADVTSFKILCPSWGRGTLPGNKLNSFIFAKSTAALSDSLEMALSGIPVTDKALRASIPSFPIPDATGWLKMSENLLFFCTANSSSVLILLSRKKSLVCGERFKISTDWDPVLLIGGIKLPL